MTTMFKMSSIGLLNNLYNMKEKKLFISTVKSGMQFLFENVQRRFNNFYFILEISNESPDIVRTNITFDELW